MHEHDFHDFEHDFHLEDVLTKSVSPLPMFAIFIFFKFFYSLKIAQYCEVCSMSLLGFTSFVLHNLE